MIVKGYSYRFAEEILQHPKYCGAFNELIRVCIECPLPVYEGKSTKQSNKDVIQPIMRKYLNRKLKRGLLGINR